MGSIAALAVFVGCGGRLASGLSEFEDGADDAVLDASAADGNASSTSATTPGSSGGGSSSGGSSGGSSSGGWPPPDPDPWKDASNDVSLDTYDAGTPLDNDGCSPVTETVGPIDPTPPPGPPLCDEKAAYLVSTTGAFYAFDVATLQANPLGTLACPASANAWPMTMTVRGEHAYVLYSDGGLFRVDLNGLACTKTSFVSNPFGFPSNSAVATGFEPDSVLLAGCQRTACGCQHALARTDPVTFETSLIGRLRPRVLDGFPLEVKTDAYGRVLVGNAGGTIVMVDPATAQVLGKDETNVGAGGNWALLPWKGGLYIFAASDGQVSRYDFTTRQSTFLTVVGDRITGAGVTCLP